METYNRFVQAHDATRDVYVAAASTGKAAVSIRGTTLHTAFGIKVLQPKQELSLENLQEHQTVFLNVQVVFIDEVSMVGSGMLATISSRLKCFTKQHDLPFGGLDIVFCGDLRQLPPVGMLPVYEAQEPGLYRSVLWQSSKYHPLTKVS